MLLELLVSKGKPMSGRLVFLLSYEAGFALAHRVLGELDILLFVPLYGYICLIWKLYPKWLLSAVSTACLAAVKALFS